MIVAPPPPFISVYKAADHRPLAFMGIIIHGDAELRKKAADIVTRAGFEPGYPEPDEVMTVFPLGTSRDAALGLYRRIRGLKGHVELVLTSPAAFDDGRLDTGNEMTVEETDFIEEPKK